MEIEIRADRAIIDGYVNAVGRDSRVITTPTGKFVEQAEPGVFREALTRAVNVDLLVNHNKQKKVGSTSEGNLILTEDNIGLRAHAEVTDADTIEKARRGEFRGWSYGMYVNRDKMEQRAEGVPRRHLEDIDIFEVSLIDRTMQPCYAGTSVECRAEGEEDALAETRGYDDEVKVVDTVPAETPDLSDYEARAAALACMPFEKRMEELRYNPYHDPSNGKFTSSGGSGGAYLFVGKGQRGKGAYVVDSGKFETPAAADQQIKQLSEEAEKLYPFINPNINPNFPENFSESKRQRWYEINREINALKSQAAEASIQKGKLRPKEPAAPHKFINGFGEATTREITTPTYKRQQARLDKEIQSRMRGYRAEPLTVEEAERRAAELVAVPYQ